MTEDEAVEITKEFIVQFPDKDEIYIDVPIEVFETGRNAVRDYIQWELARRFARSIEAKDEGRASSGYYLSHDRRIDHYIEELEEVPEEEEEVEEPPDLTDLEEYLMEGGGGGIDYVVYHQKAKP